MSNYKIFTLCCCLTVLFAVSMQPTEVSGAKKRYERSLIEYTIPDVDLINQDRNTINLKEFLNSDKPVVLDFIFGTCTTICPVLSAGFSNMQKKLGPDVENVRLVSISIDPEYDTPEVMKNYLARYKAQPGWDFFTGSREDIDATMNAFDAYTPNKMSHYPVTFLWVPGNEKWVRIYGMISTKDLMTEYSLLVNEKK